MVREERYIRIGENDEGWVVARTVRGIRVSGGLPKDFPELCDTVMRSLSGVPQEGDYKIVYDIKKRSIGNREKEVLQGILNYHNRLARVSEIALERKV
jgi:hypothetical protein